MAACSTHQVIVLVWVVQNLNNACAVVHLELYHVGSIMTTYDAPYDEELHRRQVPGAVGGYESSIVHHVCS